MFRRLLAATALALGTIAPAHAEWFEATSKHFVVYSDDSRENVKKYTERLERFDAAVRWLHVSADPDRGDAGRVVVYVMPTSTDVGQLVGSPGVAGFWMPLIHPISVMPRNTGAGSTYGFTAQAVMFHEYTHHWMLTSWADAALPAWYTEGAAEFHATAQIRPDGSVLFGATPTWRMYGVENGRNQLPVGQLLRAVPGNLSGEQTESLYARGWLLTNYLTMDPDRRKLLAQYIGAINSGKSIDQAASVLGNVSDLRLDSYARQPKWPSILAPADQLKVGDVKLRALSAAEAAVVPVLIRARTGERKNTARPILNDARAVAGRYPRDVGALTELAEAEYQAAWWGPAADAAQGYQRAISTCDQALAIDPKAVHAMILRGQALEEMAVDAKKTDAATWGEVRRWYIAANRANTEDAEPLHRFFQSFRRAKQAPTAGAMSGALYAFALAPYSPDARLDATKVLLTQGKVAQARTTIAPIVYKTSKDSAKYYAKILAAIDANDTAGALAAIKELEDKEEADANKQRGRA